MSFRSLSPLLVLLLVAGCRNTSLDPATEAYLDKAARDFNLLAKAVSEQKERQLLITQSGPGRGLTFKYRIERFAAKDRDTAALKQYAETLRTELPGKLNRTELFKDLAKHQVVLTYTYAGADGAELFRIKLVPVAGQGYGPG